MFKRVLISAILMTFLALAPAWGSQGTGNGSGGTDGDPQSPKAIQLHQEYQNTGEDIRNSLQNGTLNETEMPDELLTRTREQLQLMQQNRSMTCEDCRQLCSDLIRLKEQYRQQNPDDGTREQVTGMFRSAYQLNREQNYNQEAEQLLRHLIDLEPGNPENYRELGDLLRYRERTRLMLFCDGSELKPDAEPVTRQGRVLVPVRNIAESLKAQVQWREAEQTVNMNKDGDIIQLRIRNNVALVNGEEVELDAPAEIINSRVMVPLRFMAQVFGAEVSYFPADRIIAINQQ